MFTYRLCLGKKIFKPLFLKIISFHKELIMSCSDQLYEDFPEIYKNIKLGKILKYRDSLIVPFNHKSLKKACKYNRILFIRKFAKYYLALKEIIATGYHNFPEYVDISFKYKNYAVCEPLFELDNNIKQYFTRLVFVYGVTEYAFLALPLRKAHIWFACIFGKIDFYFQYKDKIQFDIAECIRLASQFKRLEIVKDLWPACKDAELIFSSTCSFKFASQIVSQEDMDNYALKIAKKNDRYAFSKIKRYITNLDVCIEYLD